MSKRSISNKFYLNDAGERSNSPMPDSVIVGFEFYTGKKDEKGKNIVRATQHLDTREMTVDTNARATCHGYAQKVGDEWSGKGDEAEEICITMIERLKLDEWNIAKGGAGPRPSMVLAAVLAVLADNEILAVDDEGADNGLTAEITEQLAVEGARADALKDPLINAKYEQLRADAAVERAQKAAEAAQASDTTGGFLAGLLGESDNDDDDEPEVEETTDPAETA